MKEQNKYGGIDLATSITGLAKATIYNLVSKGEIPFIKKRRKLYFNEDDLINWIESGDVSSNSNEVGSKAMKLPIFQFHSTNSNAYFRKRNMFYCVIAGQKAISLDIKRNVLRSIAYLDNIDYYEQVSEDVFVSELKKTLKTLLGNLLD